MSTPESQSPVADRLGALTEALRAGDDQQVGALLDTLHPAEIAGFLESLPTSEREPVWDALARPRQAEVLVELAEGVRQGFLEAMDLDELLALTEELDPDDVTDVVGELPEHRMLELLGALDQHDRQRLEQMLAYPEDTAGGLMTPDAVTVRPDITVDVVLRYLRQRGGIPEATDKLVVVDREDRYLGVVPLTTLLTHKPGAVIGELLDRETAAIPVTTPAREVAQTFARRDLISAPVVDAQGRFLGRITIDDVVDVLRETADQSFLGMAGVSREEDLFAPVVTSARRRAVWLGVNLVTALLAAAVIRSFEGTIEKMVALAVLMPVVASMGGNAGNQTVALVIRALALGQIGRRNGLRLLRHEVEVGLLHSALWGFAVAMVAGIWFQHAALGLVIGAAMIINLVTAAAAGFLIPVVLRRVGVDPAVASTVFLTTTTDVIGFLAFLGLASTFLM